MEFLLEYALFLAKAVTVVIAVFALVAIVIGAASKGARGSAKGELTVEDVSEHLNDQKLDLERSLLSKDEAKAFDKALKKSEKEKAQEDDKPRMFILDFDGDMHASETDSLREEVTAIISIAKEQDEVLVRLESPGGVVHGYGLASSQLARLKDANLKVTVAVDKVAASGGYMMACIADKIISAPFAILGSIGVVAQLPNINKLLKRNHIDIEQHTAGEFKRTLTVMGENTDEARAKFKQELEETHVLFKQFVSEHRPELNIEKVATGEHWYGKQAIELGLVDEIQTSDDFVLQQNEQKQLYKVEYKLKKNVAEKLGLAAATALSKTWSKLASSDIKNTK